MTQAPLASRHKEPRSYLVCTSHCLHAAHYPVEVAVLAARQLLDATSTPLGFLAAPGHTLHRTRYNSVWPCQQSLGSRYDTSWKGQLGSQGTAYIS